MRRTLNLSKTRNSANAEEVDTSNVLGVAIAFGKRKKTRSDSLAGAKGPVTEVLKEGWLEKRGEKLNRDWKKRYFLLEYGVLWYYKEKPTEEQRRLWKKASGGTSPRRTGDAAKIAPPPEVKGGQKTLGFFLLNNAKVKVENRMITLEGPLLDHHTDWSWDKKELRIREEDAEEEFDWQTFLQKAVPYENTLKNFDKLPTRGDTGGEHPLPDHIGKIFFLSQNPHKMSATEVVEASKTEFSAEEAVYCVAVLPAIEKSLARGVDFSDDKEKILYDDDGADGAYFLSTVPLIILEVDGQRFEGGERQERIGEMEISQLAMMDHPQLVYFALRQEIEVPNRKRPSHLPFSLVEPMYSGDTRKVRVQYFVTLQKMGSYSSGETGRFYRYLADGEATVAFDESIGGDRLVVLNWRELEAEQEERNRQIEEGGGGGGNDDDDYDNDRPSSSSSYKSPTTSRSGGSSSSSSSSSTKKTEPKKEAKKPEPKKPEPKKVEKKLTECYQCKGSGKAKCLCTQGTKSDTAKCSKCKGSGLGSGKCITCNGVGKK